MPKTIISKELAASAKKALLKMKSNGTTANKLKSIIAAQKYGIKKVSQIFDCDPTSIHRWAVQLVKNGEESLINRAKHKDGIKLKKHHKEKIKQWLQKDPNISIIWVKENIKKQFNLQVSRSTIHRAMKEAGFSYITQRKIHYKQDQVAVESFKKKSSK